MEKQILQVRELMLHASRTPLPETPILPLKEQREQMMDALDNITTQLEQAEDITTFAHALTSTMYALVGIAHESGVADRIIQMFDEVHRATIHDGSPDLTHIMERDYTVYKSLSEEAMELELREKLLLESLVLKNIKSRLRPADLKSWNSYESLEKRLDKKVNVHYSGGGIHERIAHVSVYGNPVDVRIDFSEKPARKKRDPKEKVKYGKMKSLNKTEDDGGL